MKDGGGKGERVGRKGKGLKGSAVQLEVETVASSGSLFVPPKLFTKGVLRRESIYKHMISFKRAELPPRLRSDAPLSVVFDSATCLASQSILFAVPRIAYAQTSFRSTFQALGTYARAHAGLLPDF